MEWKNLQGPATKLNEENKMQLHLECSGHIECKEV